MQLNTNSKIKTSFMFIHIVNIVSVCIIGLLVPSLFFFLVVSVSVLLNTAKDDKGPQTDVLSTAKNEKGS